MMNEWIVSSSILIGAVLLGRFLIRGRISLRLQYALWGVVLLRLLLPIQLFSGDFGAGALARNVDITEPVHQVYMTAREDDYQREYDAAYRQIVAVYETASRTYEPMEVEREAAAQARENIELDLNKILLGLWFTGMVVMTAVIVSCNLHLGLRLRRSRRELPVADSLLSVYVTEAVPTPCLFGLFRPAIYLTPDAAEREQDRLHALTHELTHYRHLDHIWSVLRSACLVLHWYNPLVWIAAKVSRADGELACDEGVLDRLGEEHRADYGRTLIRMTCAGQAGSVFVTATTMTGSAGALRERIKLLMKRPRNTVLTLTAVLLLGVLAVGCAFTGAPETTQPEQTEPPGETTHPQEMTESVDQTTLPYVQLAKPMEEALADYADRNPQELSEKDLNTFRTAFTALKEDGSANPAACFLVSYYADISEMSGAEFLAYFPVCTEGTQEEFELLKAKYPVFFEDWTWENMPLPIHRFERSDVNDVLGRYANLHWEELDDDVHYLEETGCYYNYTSDFGLGGFYARGGFVYDGGAVVYSDWSALFFTETLGSYTIQAHLPLAQ